jgi:hypothetical protein
MHPTERNVRSHSQCVASFFRLLRPEGQEDADGSMDIYFGSTAPRGLEAIWIPTVAGYDWFAYFRLYGLRDASMVGLAVRTPSAYSNTYSPKPADGHPMV